MVDEQIKLCETRWVVIVQSLRVLQGISRVCGFPRTHREALGCEQTEHGDQRAENAMQCTSELLVAHDLMP